MNLRDALEYLNSLGTKEAVDVSWFLMGLDSQLLLANLRENEACGFAWDCGREMAALEKERVSDLVNKIFQKISAGETLNSPQIIPNNIPVEATGDVDPGGEDQTRVALVVDGRVEAIGDLDPGIYEGTGAGFKR